MLSPGQAAALISGMASVVVAGHAAGSNANYQEAKMLVAVFGVAYAVACNSFDVLPVLVFTAVVSILEGNEKRSREDAQ